MGMGSGSRVVFSIVVAFLAAELDRHGRLQGRRERADGRRMVHALPAAIPAIDPVRPTVPQPWSRSG